MIFWTSCKMITRNSYRIYIYPVYPVIDESVSETNDFSLSETCLLHKNLQNMYKQCRIENKHATQRSILGPDFIPFESWSIRRDCMILDFILGFPKLGYTFYRNGK